MAEFAGLIPSTECEGVAKRLCHRRRRLLEAVAEHAIVRRIAAGCEAGFEVDEQASSMVVDCEALLSVAVDDRAPTFYKPTNDLRNVNQSVFRWFMELAIHREQLSIGANRRIQNAPAVSPPPLSYATYRRLADRQRRNEIKKHRLTFPQWQSTPGLSSVPVGLSRRLSRAANHDNVWSRARAIVL